MERQELIDAVWNAMANAQDYDTNLNDFARAVVDKVPAIADGLVWREIALAMAPHIGHLGYEALRDSGHWSKFQNLLAHETPIIKPAVSA